MDITALRSALHHTPVSELRAFDEIGSTNDEALRWSDAGAPDFALVIADRQIRGRGRLERQWITQPGASLAFSLILRPTPQEAAASNALYAPLCGLAVWQALHDCCGLEAQIKWPNDVLLDRKKCAGVLVEATWMGPQLTGLVLGIGLNLTADSLPAEAAMRFPATWVERYTPGPLDRFALLAAIMNGVQFWRTQLGTPLFFSTWQDHLAFKGEAVSIVENEISSIIGIEEGIDPTGALILREANGHKVTVTVGDVSLRSNQ